MFYAIEANNGQRADRVVEFSARRLRDAWIADGRTREKLSARDTRVRGAFGLEDGDDEAWHAIADARVRQSAVLRRHVATIDVDWSETDHYRWVATAPEREIVRWAEDIESYAE